MTDDLSPASEYSLDEGESWQRLAFEPPPPGHTEGPPSLSSAVEVPGGWLATATSSVDADSSGAYYGHLLHSDDGRSWTQLLPTDACPSTGGRRVGESSVTRPVRFGGRWYVAFSCRNSTPFAAIYSGGAEADVFRPLEGTRREGAAFDEPIEDGARLLFPEEDANRALVGFTALA